MADHGHSHDGGDHSHAQPQSHSHGGQPCHGHGPPQTPQSAAFPPIDPVAQSQIDSDFVPADLALHPNTHTATCAHHKLEKCDSCDVDYVNTNRLARILVNNPALLCPPPNNVINQKLSELVRTTKDEGNALFKAGKPQEALPRYNAAAAYAMQRPPWEPNGLFREELTTVISNRSAVYLELKDYISALADAETVIAVRRNWPKGHFRKSKALMGLGRLQEAADALKLGLSYEPVNKELLGFLDDIERKMQELAEKRKAGKQDAPPDTPAS